MSCKNKSSYRDVLEDVTSNKNSNTALELCESETSKLQCTPNRFKFHSHFETVA